MENKNTLVITASILGASFIIAILIFSMTFKSTKNAEQNITVTGSAKKNITSDLGIQRGTLQATSNERKTAYQIIQQQMPLILKFLEDKGFKKDQIEVFSINGYPVYEINPSGVQTSKILYYTYNQRFEVRSNEVNKIKELSVLLSSLVEKGLDISTDMPEYIYTKLDDIKILIQAEAAKNAMERAEKIALATGRELGPLRSARMGVLQITPKNSNVISDYGMNDVSSIEKEITAVVSASFEIK
ncbi:MAG: SIMPL domain-containing protein [Melioribacteraceae bacterium]|nr:SIMPL domain-containing protein [Melioribacteraceae bacterium]